MDMRTLGVILAICTVVGGVAGTITLKEYVWPSQGIAASVQGLHVSSSSVSQSSAAGQPLVNDLTPPEVDVHAGQAFRPAAQWAYVCTGDMDRVNSDGTVVALHDAIQETGAIIELPAGSSFELSAPFGAHCSGTTPGGLVALVDDRKAEMLRSPNCAGNGCTSVEIFDLNAIGNVVEVD